MKLTKEAQDLINQKVDSKLEEAEDLINNLKWWKSTFLVIVGFLSLTSIGGFITYKNYLDDFVDSRVAKRFEVYEDINLGTEYADADDWEYALYLVSNSLERIKSEKITVKDKFLDLHYNNLLWILSNIESNGSKEEIGEFHWNQLKKDVGFHNYSASMSDEELHNEDLAFCILKYERDVDKAFNIAESKFKQALEESDYLIENGRVYKYLSIIEFVKGNEESSCEYIKKAAELDPENYLVEDVLKYYNSFENSIRSDVWELIYSRKNKVEFDEKCRTQFHLEYKKVLEKCK